MKLLTYEDLGVRRVGIYVGEKIADLSRVAVALGHPPLPVESMRDLIRCWDRIGSGLRKIQAEAETKAEELSSILIAPEDILFLSPVPDPPKNVLCIGLNYKDHAAEGVRKGAVPQSMAENPHPIFFTKAPTALIGHGAGILKHACTNELDYEGELAVIIGRRGRNIPKENVYHHIFGYCCGNDVSARDLQRRHKQIFKGKTLDGSCPLGPFIVPKEDYGDPMNVLVRTRVNGELRQNASTSLMIHDISTMISVLSEGFTLEPGDIFLTGTPSGVGYARQTPSFLQVGDVVEVEVEGLGKLQNRVVEPRNNLIL